MSNILDFKAKGFKIIMLIVLCLSFTITVPAYASTIPTEKKMGQLNELLAEIEQQEESGQGVSQETLEELEVLISEFDISPTEIQVEVDNIMARGFNQKHSLGKGWTMEVHRPHGSNATEYHTHVKGKVGNKTVEAKESLQGKSTHGSGNTMNDKKVPKDIQKKVKGHKDFKKAKEEESKTKKAKKQINAQKLNLKKTADIIIAIGIFVAVVGVVLLATSSIAAWAAILIAI